MLLVLRSLWEGPAAPAENWTTRVVVTAIAAAPATSVRSYASTASLPKAGSTRSSTRQQVVTKPGH